MAFVSLLALPTPALAAETASQPAPGAATPATSSSVIPVSEVAKRAGEVANFVRDLTERPLSAEIEMFRKRLPDVHERIDRGLADVDRILADQPTLDAIQAQ